MSLEITTIVLSSTVIAALVSAVIAGWVSLRGKRNDYANEYFKNVISRRLSAYEQIESLIIPIKIAVMDTDQRPYYLLFSDEENYTSVYKKLMGVLSQSLWISDGLFDLVRALNVLVYSNGNNSIVEFGKSNYIAIGKLRTKIEIIHAQDMLSLHEVPQFLKSKRPTDTYLKLPSIDQSAEA